MSQDVYVCIVDDDGPTALRVQQSNCLDKAARLARSLRDGVTLYVCADPDAPDGDWRFRSESAGR